MKGLRMVAGCSARGTPPSAACRVQKMDSQAFGHGWIADGPLIQEVHSIDPAAKRAGSGATGSHEPVAMRRLNRQAG
jgi:hypothetical protein